MYVFYVYMLCYLLVEFVHLSIMRSFSFFPLSLQVGSRYLDHLIVERKYSEAASLCPKLLRGSAPAWERYNLSLFVSLLLCSDL